MSESIARKTIKYQSYKKDWAKRDNPASASFEKEILKNKNLNPAGKLKVKTSYAPFGSMTIHEAKALPDPGHAARLRGMAERKARGTQSSSQRKIIK